MKKKIKYGIGILGAATLASSAIMTPMVFSKNTNPNDKIVKYMSNEGVLKNIQPTKIFATANNYSESDLVENHLPEKIEIGCFNGVSKILNLNDIDKYDIKIISADGKDLTNGTIESNSTIFLHGTRDKSGNRIEMAYNVPVLQKLIPEIGYNEEKKYFISVPVDSGLNIIVTSNTGQVKENNNIVEGDIITYHFMNSDLNFSYLIKKSIFFAVEPKIHFTENNGFVLNDEFQNFIVKDAAGNIKSPNHLITTDTYTLEKIDFEGNIISSYTKAFGDMLKVIMIPEINEFGTVTNAEYFNITQTTYRGPGGEIWKFIFTPKYDYILMPNFAREIYYVKSLNVIEQLSSDISISNDNVGLHSSWSTYNYNSIGNDFQIQGTITRDGAIDQLAFAVRAETNEGHRPVTHIRISQNNLRYKLIRDGHVISRGYLDDIDETLYHAGPNIANIFGSILAPFSGTIGAGFQFIGGAALGLATWLVDQTGESQYEFVDYMRYFTGISDRLEGSDPGIGYDIFRSIGGVAATFGASAVIKGLSIGTKIATALNISAETADAMTINTLINLATGVEMGISGGEYSAAVAQRILPILSTLKINISEEFLASIIYKIGKLPLSAIRALSKLGDNEIDLILESQNYANISRENINDMIAYVNNQNVKANLQRIDHVADNSLEHPINVLAGDKLIITGHQRFEIGANSSGWSMFHAGGYWSEATLESIMLYIRTVSNNNILTIEPTQTELTDN